MSERIRATRITDNPNVRTECSDQICQQAALLKIDALQHAILYSANFSSIATDEKGVIQIFNIGSERMLGYTATEMVNRRNLTDIFDTQELSARAVTLEHEFGVPIPSGFEALVYKAMCGIEDIFELTYLRKDKRRLPVLVSVTALCNAQQAIIGYLLISTDNRARKQAEQTLHIADAEMERLRTVEALRVSDQHYQTRFQSLDGFCILEKMAVESNAPLDFRYIEVNAAFAMQSGVNDVLGKTLRQILPDEAEEWLSIYDQVLTTGQPIRFERCLRVNGRVLEIHAFRIEDPTYQRIGVSFINISARKLAEEQLRTSEAFNRSIIKSSPDCIKVLDLEGNLLAILSGQELLEIEEIEPYLNKSWIDFWQDDDRQAAQAAIEAATAGRIGKFVGFFPTLRGIPKWWDVAVSPILDATGKPLHLLVISRDITERKHIELALHQRTVQFETLINVAPLGLYLIDANFRIRQINPTALAVFENLPDLVGRDFGDVLHSLWPKVKADEIIQKFRHTLETGEALHVPEQLNEGRAPASTEYYEWQINRIPLPESDYGVVCYFRDISVRVMAQQKISESEERYRNLFNSIDEGFCVIEMIFDKRNKPVDWRFVEANPSFEKQTGLSDIVGKRMRELAPYHEAYWFETYGKVALTGEPVRFANKAEALNNQWFDLYAFHVGGHGSKKVAVIFTNITERKATEKALRESVSELRTTESDLRTTEAALYEEKATLADHVIKLQQMNDHLVVTTLEAHALAEEIEQARIKMAHLAQHDALTDLPNRLLLNDRLKQAITLGRRHDKKLAVLFLDLDRFKLINDSLGHVVGDQLLQSVAKSLVSCISESDTVCRQGGDEFVILLDDLEHAEDAERIAQKILAVLTTPHLIDRHELHITVSIGISIFPNDGRDAETLIKNADTAMYHAKEDGRNNYQFFEDKMNTRAVERQLVEMCLRRALAQQEFELYYQPKINLQSGEIVGVEALIRWQHPHRGLLLPQQFVSIAEDSGLILPIGRWVLHEACRQAQVWVMAGLAPITVAVNTSALEFRAKDFLANVSAILEDTGLDPRCLEIELTESVLMRDAKATDAMLHALAHLGVKLAIDDFGTGYSSLSYLRQFPIDTLKIDQSFVNQMTNNPDDATIVSAVISMGKSLNQLVIAEGVETAEQHAFLLAKNCDEGQGYYYARPMPADALATLMQTGVSVNHPVN